MIYPASGWWLTTRTVFSALCLCSVASVNATAAPADFSLVGEMLNPAGIVASPARARRDLASHPAAQPAVQALRERVASQWTQIRNTDFVALSRFHVEATRGWQAPVKPGVLEARVIGVDERGDLYLELRGPRLPASFDIVHRYITVFARYAPASGTLDRLTLSIRGEVLE